MRPDEADWDHWNEDEAWWHHSNEVQWLENEQTRETYHVRDRRLNAIIDAVYSDPHVDEGCHYPCKQRDIETVLEPLEPLPPPRKVSYRQALDEFATFNETDRRPDRSMRRSIRHLDKYLFNRSRLRSREIPGLVFKAFRDLDKVLFDVYLFGRVQLVWAGTRLVENVHAQPGPDLMAFTRFRHSGAFIFLCVDNLLLGRGTTAYENLWDNLLVTLIHEMLHAYIYIRCGLEDIAPGHPECWWDALGALGYHLSEEFGFEYLEDHANRGNVDCGVPR